MSRKREVLLVVVAMVLGYAAWILPRVLVPGPVNGHFPLLVEFSTDPERANWYSLLSLVSIGVLLGLLSGKNYKFGAKLGAFTGVPIAVLALVEGVLGLASHSLFGIELFMYALFTIPAILGAMLGVFVKRRFSGLRPLSGNTIG
jgi:hypothetical protein